MKSTLLICVLFACSCVGAQAAKIVDTWSAAGGAWDPARQAQFASTGVLNPDAGSRGGARLINPDKQGIYETLFYTFFSAPTLVVEGETAAEKLQTIALELVISTELDEGPTLNFNTEHAAVAPTRVSEAEAPAINGHEARTRTFVWNVADLGASDVFSIRFALGPHVAFTRVQLVQAAAE